MNQTEALITKLTELTKAKKIPWKLTTGTTTKWFTFAFGHTSASVGGLFVGRPLDRIDLWIGKDGHEVLVGSFHEGCDLFDACLANNYPETKQGTAEKDAAAVTHLLNYLNKIK